LESNKIVRARKVLKESTLLYIHTPFEAEPEKTGSKVSRALQRQSGGIYSEQLNIRKSFRLPDHCSVFQAEVFAIIEALMLLNGANCQNKLINIYSDSQAAIRSIISTNTNSHTKQTAANLCTRWLCRLKFT